MIVQSFLPYKITYPDRKPAGSIKIGTFYPQNNLLILANSFILLPFQKRRKELEEASVNDGLLLAKSSLNINLLPENEDDRNMASLLSLRPSKSIEESQNQTRSKILNMPALPSSSGLLTSFGGLKKEESLGKSTLLTRQTLGITFKRSKVENNSSLSKNKDKVSDLDEENTTLQNTEDEVINKNDGQHLFNNITPGSSEEEGNNEIDDKKLNEKVENNEKQIKRDSKDSEIVVDKKEIDTLIAMKDENKKVLKGTNTIKEEIVTKKISLVCDYSSSGESSEG